MMTDPTLKPQSMTGYGKGIKGDYVVEMRSSNHKHIDISINLPHSLFACEIEIKKRIRKEFHRGRVEVLIPRQNNDSSKMVINRPLAREYFKAFQTLKEELSLKDHIDINMIASQRNVLVPDETDPETDDLYDALEMALGHLKNSRILEADNLVQDIEQRLTMVDRYMSEIESVRDDFRENSRARLEGKLHEYLHGVEIDQSRLIQEVAILIEKTDITEEIVRIHSHIKNFRRVMSGGDTTGKKLDFIIQELRREINTIGSKCQDFGIANSVVNVKHELEKIREQVQNLQ